MMRVLVMLALLMAVSSAAAQTYPRLELSALAGTRGAERDDPIIGGFMYQGMRGLRADLFLRRTTSGSVGISAQYEVATRREYHCVPGHCPTGVQLLSAPNVPPGDPYVFAPLDIDARSWSAGPVIRIDVQRWLSVDLALRAGWLLRSSRWDYGSLDQAKAGTAMVASDMSATMRWSAFTAGVSYESGRLLYRSGTTHTQRLAGRLGLQVPLRQ